MAPIHGFHYVVGILEENDEKSDVIEYFLRGKRKIELRHCGRLNSMSPPWVLRLEERERMRPYDPILFPSHLPGPEKKLQFQQDCEQNWRRRTRKYPLDGTEKVLILSDVIYLTPPTPDERATLN